MKKLSQKDIVLKQMREFGRVRRNWCLSRIPAITRLSAIMLDLKNEGVNFEPKEVDGDYHYILKDRPKQVIEYRVQGELVGKKLVW